VGIHLDERNVMRTLTAYIEFDPETNLYVGFVPGVAGAHSQGATLDELHENLKEVLELCLEENRAA
jgi:predicted RNase H-like HicB family nuclease